MFVCFLCFSNNSRLLKLFRAAVNEWGLPSLVWSDEGGEILKGPGLCCCTLKEVMVVSGKTLARYLPGSVKNIFRSISIISTCQHCK